jgi:hypothetical protein
VATGQPREEEREADVASSVEHRYAKAAPTSVNWAETFMPTLVIAVMITTALKPYSMASRWIGLS